MYKRTLLAVSIALLSTVAYATNNNNQNCNGNGSCATNVTNNTTNQGGSANAGAAASVDVSNVNRNNNTNNNSNVNRNSNSQHQGQAQGQHQGQLQGQLQGQGQSQSADNKGNSQSMTYNEAKPVRQAPGLGVGAATSTAVCMVGVSGGLSVPVGAVAFGTATRDAICSLLEVGKSMISIGLHTGDNAMVTEGRDFIKEAGLRLMDEIGTRKPAAAKSTETYPTFSN